MNKFDKIWHQGLDTLPERVVDGRETLALLEEINFPAALSLLAAAGKDSGDRLLGRALLDKIAETAAAGADPKHGLDADGAASILSQIFVQRRDPRAVLTDEAVLALLMRAAGQVLNSQGVPVRPEEVLKAAQLIASGKFFLDVATSTAAVVSAVPKLPIALVKDVRSIAAPDLPRKIAQLTLAVGRDVVAVPVEIPSVIADLLDGTLDKPPAVMTHTLQWLYEIATVETTVEMIRALLDPGNETVRLALILYARANGIPLEADDLDVLRDSVFNSAAPDLGPALAAGLETLMSRYGKPGLLKLLRSFAV